jgi:hypothetical protein
MFQYSNKHTRTFIEESSSIADKLNQIPYYQSIRSAYTISIPPASEFNELWKPALPHFAKLNEYFGDSQ